RSALNGRDAYFGRIVANNVKRHAAACRLGVQIVLNRLDALGIQSVPSLDKLSGPGWIVATVLGLLQGDGWRGAGRPRRQVGEVLFAPRREVCRSRLEVMIPDRLIENMTV